jgi:hypothetical protein
MDRVIPDLENRCKNGESVQCIDNDRRIIRLTQTKRVKLGNDREGVALLFSLGDRDKADPGFANFETGQIRIERKKENEGGGLSVHAIIELTPTKVRGHFYRVVYEDVTGFGRTLLQGFLRHEFKIICEEAGAKFRRQNNRELKTRPLVELTGHASEPLKKSLKTGQLQYVELIDYVTDDLGMDEGFFVKTARRNLAISISKDQPAGDGLKIIEKIKEWAKKEGYANMRVRWREPTIKKPRSANIEVMKADAGEALFVKNAELHLKYALPDISDHMSDELINKMRELLD